MLARLGDDRDLARQLAVIFVDECPRLLEAVRVSVEHGSADEVRRAAHALKGAVLNFVDDGAAATAYALETMARENRLGDAAAAVDRLGGELSALLEHLRHFGAGAHADPDRG